MRYLETHNVMTLATSGPEGLWAAAVFYVSDGFTFYFLSAPSSRHCLNLSVRSEVAATIQEDYEDWRKIQGVQLEGLASRISGTEQQSAAAQYSRKFPVVSDAKTAPPEIAASLEKAAWFKIVPTKLLFIDNGLGLGHRDAVPLSGAD